jgi:AhpD family alkylhydroperoxidase
MSLRMDYVAASPEGIRALRRVDGYLLQSGLSKSLLELVYLRVSQINGCAYCVDLHARDARAKGETERRVNSVVTWREAPFYSPRERAALAWAESLTRIAETRAPDEDYEAAKAQFSEKELVDLTLAIGLMNALNRLAVGFRRGPTPEPA